MNPKLWSLLLAFNCFAPHHIRVLRVEYIDVTPTSNAASWISAAESCSQEYIDNDNQENEGKQAENIFSESFDVELKIHCYFEKN